MISVSTATTCPASFAQGVSTPKSSMSPRISVIVPASRRPRTSVESNRSVAVRARRKDR